MLTIVTPSPTYDLTILATVKSELKITATTDDDWLSSVISDCSADFAGECDRVFAAETVRETLHFARRHRHHHRAHGEDPRPVILERTPVTDIASVTGDGTALAADLYEIEADTGFLYRLDANGNRTDWSVAKLEVQYIGGYALLGELPRDIERAVIALVKQRWFSRRRDPLVKAETIDGVGSEQYWVGPVPGAASGTYPDETQRAIDRYRRVLV